MTRYISTVLFALALAACGEDQVAAITDAGAVTLGRCTKNSDCPEGTVCQANGICLETKTTEKVVEVETYGACTDSAQCLDGRICADGFCVRPDPPPLVCSMNPHRIDYLACDGRCVNSGWDSANCGGCDIRCTNNTYCQFGNCICPFYTSFCDGKCINTISDPENCGGCGIRCATGQMCEHGQCSNNCWQGLTGSLTVCDGQCVDIVWDPDNCGQCGRRCNGQNIVTRKCVFDCQGDCENGFLDCDDNQYANGCEVDAKNDPDNCGACGVKCPHACVNGTCK